MVESETVTDLWKKVQNTPVILIFCVISLPIRIFCHISEVGYWKNVGPLCSRPWKQEGKMLPRCDEDAEEDPFFFPFKDATLTPTNNNEILTWGYEDADISSTATMPLQQGGKRCYACRRVGHTSTSCMFATTPGSARHQPQTSQVSQVTSV